MVFVLFSASLPTAMFEVKLENPQKQEVAIQIANFSHVLAASIYNYGPVSYGKIKAITPEKSEGTKIKDLLLQYSPSKIAELVKPALALKLDGPTDESQVKKFKERQKALEQISVCAFLHAIFTRYYSQCFPETGATPQKTGVRLASNLPEWQVVKKVDAQKQSTEEVFMSIASIYHSLHSKYPLFSQVPLVPMQQGRKSFSTLLQLLSQAPLSCAGTGFESEWAVFEAFNAAGFPLVPAPQTIGELYPQLKVPKPRGNFSSKKK